MPTDRIQISDLSVHCIVGILPPERVREQPLLVDVELTLDTATAGRSGKIADTVDYDRVAEEVAALLRFRRYRLLEIAAEEVAAMLLGVHAAVERVSLRFTKPRALEGRAQSVSLTIERERADYPMGHEDTEFGTVDVLFETREAGLYLLHVDPKSSIPPHYHRVMRELEWLVEGELLRDGRPLKGLAPVAWDKGRVHTYDNPGDTLATLFCCDSPPFIPEDEVVIDKEESGS